MAYEASDEEQLKDVGIEAALNLGGTVIGAGVKPTIGLIADGVAKFGKLFGNAPAAVKNMFMEGWGGATGVGAKNIATLIDNPDAVSSVMKQAGKLGEDPVGALIRQNIDDVAKISAGQSLSCI